MFSSNATDVGIEIIYDGECPFCSSYVRLVNLRKNVGRVTLLDARSSHPLVEEVKRLGYDLDEGMIVRFEGRFYHGAEAMRLLTALSVHSGILAGIMRPLFASSHRAKWAYPALRTGRNLALRLLGRSKIMDR